MTIVYEITKTVRIIRSDTDDPPPRRDSDPSTVVPTNRRIVRSTTGTPVAERVQEIVQRRAS